MISGSRKQLDAQLKELALLAQRHPHATKGRRIALTQLVSAIWQSGKLCRPYSGQFQLLYEDIYEKQYKTYSFIFVKLKILTSMTQNVAKS